MKTNRIFNLLMVIFATYAGNTQNLVELAPTTLTVPGDKNTLVGASSLSPQNWINGFTGDYNVGFGHRALRFNQGGSDNTAVGAAAMDNNLTGMNNTAIGRTALINNEEGSANVAIGRFAIGNSLGDSNTSVGALSGGNLQNGDRNIFLGNSAGPTTGNTFSDRLYIHNSASDNPLIYGEFNNRQLGFNVTAANARVRITSSGANISGLQFANLNNGSTVVPNPGTGVLSVNNAGDVILVNDATMANPNDDWKLLGNANTTPSLVVNHTSDPLSNYLGTSDDQDLVFRRNKIKAGQLSATNTAFGVGTLSPVTSITGSNNVAIGTNALNRTTSGNLNVSIGVSSLQNNTTGKYNVGVGFETLKGTALSVTGEYNTAIGHQAGQATNAGKSNVFVGNAAGYDNVNGIGNIFLGNHAGKGLPTNTDRKLIISNTDIATTPLVYGELDKKIFKVNADFDGNSRLIVNSFTTGPSGTSGLQFTNLKEGNNATANTNHKFLTVDPNGDVILQTLASIVTDDLSIYTSDHAIVTPGSGPGSGLRTVTMGDNNLFFDTSASNFVDGTVGTGRVYIGNTTNNFPILASTPSDSHYRLLVEGGILTEKIKVAVSGGINWADYVFAKDYRLMPLGEVDSFVKANQHLPGIESAEELAKNGLDLGEMQAKQMGKIEELTLYIIEQDKTLKGQNTQLQKQGLEIEQLKAQVKALLELKQH